jgi:hypothetical protein
MLELQLALYLLDTLNSRAAALRLHSDRGDVAEKIVLVGIFVALAIAVGAVITKAVTTDAAHVASTITSSTK